jgi:hypothetical protein
MSRLSRHLRRGHSFVLGSFCEPICAHAREARFMAAAPPMTAFIFG